MAICPKKITLDFKGDFNDIIENLNQNIDAINALIEDAFMLAEAAVEGNLRARANPDRHKGDFRRIIEGFNSTLDSITEPMAITSEYLNAISVGDIPESLELDFKGDFNLMKDSLNTSTAAINALVEDTMLLVSGAMEGRLDVRADTQRHKGDYRRIISGVNSTLDAITGPINMAADIIERIAAGDIPDIVSEQYKGSFDTLKANLNQCIISIGQLVDDTEILTHRALEGDFHYRADSTKHRGDFERIIIGINETLDALIDPINLSAEYLEKIASGNLPDLIENNYKGDFVDIINNLNECILAISNLIKDAGLLADAAVAGNLDVRADEFEHKGDYQKIVHGMNATLEAISEPFTMASSTISNLASGNIPEINNREFNGDWDHLRKNLNVCIESLNKLVLDANHLVEGALAGKLDNRADVEAHSGDYRKIVEGINSTLDAVIYPLKEATAVMASMSEGDFSIMMTGEYQGDHALLKNSLNNTNSSINEMMMKVRGLVESVENGSSQVSSASNTLSQGATEQAGSIEEVSATMSEMKNKIRESAENAEQANQLTEQAKENALEGDSKMKNMLDAMKSINDASSEISRIIKAIDEIAFQTNLLALNAAVEAARAGQHGKGFAVVAEEVRTLAQRSAQAAKETTELIEGTISRVQRGTHIAEDTAGALREIVDGIAAISNLVNEISIGTGQQTKGIDQVADTLMQIERITQSNTASAEQSAASSQELSGQSQSLRGTINQFKLQDGNAGFQLETSRMESSEDIFLPDTDNVR